MSPVPSGRAQQHPGRFQGPEQPGEAWGKGKDPALSPAPAARPHPKAQAEASRAAALGACQPRRFPPAPAPSTLLLTPAFGASQVGARHQTPSLAAVLRRWQNPAAKLGWAVSHRGSDRLLSLRITQRSSWLFFFSPSLHVPGASHHLPLPLPWQPPPQHPLQQQHPPQICPQSKRWRGPVCPQHRSREQPCKGVSPQGVWGASGAVAPASAAASWKWVIPGARWEGAKRSDVLPEPQWGMPMWLLCPAVATTPGVDFWPWGHRMQQLQLGPSRGSWDTPCVGFPPTVSSPSLYPCTGPQGAEPGVSLCSPAPSQQPPSSNPHPQLTQASGFGVGVRTLRRTRALFTWGRGSVVLLVLLQPGGRGGLRWGEQGCIAGCSQLRTPRRWRHSALSCARAWGQWSHGRSAPLSPTPAPHHLPWMPQELSHLQPRGNSSFGAEPPDPQFSMVAPACLPLPPCPPVTTSPYSYTPPAP